MRNVDPYTALKDVAARVTVLLPVVQRLKLSRSKPVIAPPKGGKLRDVPLPGPVADALRAHLATFPPVDITLPWMAQRGQHLTKQLIFTTAGRAKRT